MYNDHDDSLSPRRYKECHYEINNSVRAVREVYHKDPVLRGVVKEVGTGLQLASMRQRADRKLVLEAVKKDGHALLFADPLLCSDREIVLAAVENDGLALQFASKSLRADYEVVEMAARNNPDAVNWALKEVKEYFSYAEVLRGREKPREETATPDPGGRFCYAAKSNYSESPMLSDQEADREAADDIVEGGASKEDDWRPLPRDPRRSRTNPAKKVR